MKKLLTLAALLIVGTSIIGCKASAEVDPHSSAAISAPR